MPKLSELLSQEQVQEVRVEFQDPVKLRKTEFIEWANRATDELIEEISRDYPDASVEIRDAVFEMEFKKRVENKKILWQREARRINHERRERDKAYKALEREKQEKERETQYDSVLDLYGIDS